MTSRLCDTHVHVFDPSRFAYSPDRKFSPDTATAKQLATHLSALGATRVVLVQPSVYGSDHRCLLDALDTLGDQAKGVAVLAARTSSDEIEVLDYAGVVGARLNLVVNHQDNAQVAIDAIDYLESSIPSHWHIQLHVNLAMLSALTMRIQQSPRRFVLDHLGLPHVAEGTSSTHWQYLLGLVKTGQLYVKASAPYLSSQQRINYTDLQPFVESLIHTRPDCVLWGSNWPHTQGTRRNSSIPLTHIENFRNENDASWRDTCQTWASEQWRKIADSNADHLYFS